MKEGTSRVEPTRLRKDAMPASRSMGRRLLFWFLVISLAPLALSNGLGYSRSELIIDSLVRRFMAGIAEAQAVQVSDRIDRLVVVLEQLARNPDVVEAAFRPEGTEQAERVLEEAMATNAEFDALYLFEEHGRVLVSYPLGPSDIGYWIGPPLQPPHLPVQVERDLIAPHYPFVRLTASVQVSPAEQVYIGASVSLTGGQSVLSIPQHTAGNVETIMVDSAGLPVFVSHPHGHVDYSVAFDTPLIQDDAEAFATYPDRLGVTVLGTRTQVPGQPWLLLNEIPVSDALRDLRELRTLSLWLASILALAVLAAAWFVSSRIVAPVGRLVSATRRVGAGDLTTRVTPSGRDELGELAAAFNDMAETLEMTSARIAEFHQRELERAAQLATVGELAAGLAHEIKNPVAGLTGGLEMIGRRLPQEAKLDSIMAEMRTQTARIGHAVRDLLAFARPVEPNLMLTEVNPVVERAETLIKPGAENSRVSIQNEFANDLPQVEAEEEQLSQCLVNLMINAVQAVGQDGRVLVMTRIAGDGVEILVRDSGSGIPPERLETIFKPFFTTKHQGTGLGLSITAGIVEKHRGKISVESDASGTTMTIWLPSARSME